MQGLVRWLVGLAFIAASATLGIIQWTHADAVHSIAQVQAAVDKSREERMKQLDTFGLKLEKIGETTIRTDEAIQELRRRNKL